MDQKPVYKRILLKLSGEALQKNDEKGNKIDLYDFTIIDSIAAVLKRLTAAGVEIAIIVGAGNIWRGANNTNRMQRVRGDLMGMLGTTMNSIALQDAFIRNGLDTVVMSATEMDNVADHYTPRNADRALKNGQVVIIAGGTGAPFFSTDTAAVLRAAEVEADAVLMAKNVDYLYTADPKKDPNAKPIYDITYADIVEKGLRAFDMTAVIFCQDNGIESYGFALRDPENIYRAVMGEPVGTRMHN